MGNALFLCLLFPNFGVKNEEGVLNMIIQRAKQILIKESLEGG